MLELKRAGAHTIAQDENSCVVFGMPKAAIEVGSIDEVVSLGDMGERLVSFLISMERVGHRV
jgi:two-component system chemotaxis response regulator CheB